MKNSQTCHGALYLRGRIKSPAIPGRTLRAVCLSLLLALVVPAGAMGSARVEKVVLRKTINGFPITVEYVRVNSIRNRAVQLAINRDLKQDAILALRRMSEWARSLPGSTSLDSPSSHSFHGEYRSNVSFLRGNLLSVVRRGFVSLPRMAHPDSWLSSVTYDLNTGERVSLKRLLGEQWEKAVGEQVGRMAQERIAKGQLDLNEGQDIPSPDQYGQSFYIKSKPPSLVIYWERYRFTPGFNGDVEFVIPLKDLQGVIREPALRMTP